jgi:uncharacterized protein
MQPYCSKILMAAVMIAAFLPTQRAEAFCVIAAPVPIDVHDAIRHYKVKELYPLLRYRGELNDQDPDSGLRPLMTALIWEKHKHFRVLLRWGSDPDLTDRVGNSALHIAAQVNEPWLVLELLKAGANPNARNMQQQSFQAYLFMPDDNILTSRERKGRAAVIAWLREHKIEIEHESAR